METSLFIRPATPSDSTAIASLIWSLRDYFLADPSGAGAEPFLATLSGSAIAGTIANPEFHYIAAFLGESLAGVAAMRDNRHVHHLFVALAHQRRGIATQLWQRLKSQAIDAGNTTKITVNSSLFAVPAYARWGFVPTGAAQTRHGVSLQAMALTLEGQAARIR